jgi:hypothetical protein
MVQNAPKTNLTLRFVEKCLKSKIALYEFVYLTTNYEKNYKSLDVFGYMIPLSIETKNKNLKFP